MPKQNYRLEELPTGGNAIAITVRHIGERRHLERELREHMDLWF